MLMNSRPQGHAGFTLLEVLVAMIVLGIGLLGLASLQAQGMRLNYESQLRSQATILAYDITDRIRANSGPLRDPGNYEIGDAETPPNGTEVHEIDLSEWRAALAANFPEGTGSIDYDAANRIVIVRIFWSAHNSIQDDEDTRWSCNIDADASADEDPDPRACFEVRTLLSL